jgi:hypothetical protein
MKNIHSVSEICGHILNSFSTDLKGQIRVPRRFSSSLRPPYLPTPWSKVLLEKLTGSQLVKKFPAFYGTRRIITVFTSACHLSLSWASSVQSIPLHPTSRRSVLILSSRPPQHKYIRKEITLQTPVRIIYRWLLSVSNSYSTRADISQQVPQVSALWCYTSCILSYQGYSHAKTKRWYTVSLFWSTEHVYKRLPFISQTSFIYEL